MLRGSKENKCPYSKSNAPKIFHKLLKKGLIELLKSRCPKEIRRTNDLKYCKYHRVVSHAIEKCKALRRQVLQLVQEGKITLNEEDTEESD